MRPQSTPASAGRAVMAPLFPIPALAPAPVDHGTSAELGASTAAAITDAVRLSPPAHVPSALRNDRVDAGDSRATCAACGGPLHRVTAAESALVRRGWEITRCNACRTPAQARRVDGGT